MPELSKSINLNDTVRFKLTEKGKELFAAQCWLPPNADPDGWQTSQLWWLAYRIGPYLALGKDCLVLEAQLYFD